MRSLAGGYSASRYWPSFWPKLTFWTPLAIYAFQTKAQDELEVAVSQTPNETEGINAIETLVFELRRV